MSEKLERIKIHERTIDLKKFQGQVQRALRRLNELLEAYHRTGVDKSIPDLNTLLQLASDPEGFVKSYYRSKAPAQISSVPINPEKWLEMVSFPDLTDVQIAAGALRMSEMYKEGDISELFHLKEGQVLIDEAEMRREEETFMSFAATQEEHDRLAALQELADAFNKTKQFYEERNRLAKLWGTFDVPLLVFKGGKFHPNHTYVKL